MPSSCTFQYFMLKMHCLALGKNLHECNLLSSLIITKVLRKQLTFHTWSLIAFPLQVEFTTATMWNYKSKEGMFSWEAIHALIVCRLQQAVGVLLSLEVVLFYVWQCTLQYWTKLSWVRFILECKAEHRSLCNVDRSQSAQCWTNWHSCINILRRWQ